MKLALLQQLPVVEAIELLRSGNTSGMSRDEFMALVELATGSRRIAEDAARRRMAAQLDAGERPH